MAKAKEAKEEAFEDRLAKLETIVRTLETGEKGLEESLSMFEEGVGLAKGLNSRLEEVKRRVEVLTKDAEGKLKLKPLDETE